MFIRRYVYCWRICNRIEKSNSNQSPRFPLYLGMVDTQTHHTRTPESTRGRYEGCAMMGHISNIHVKFTSFFSFPSQSKQKGKSSYVQLCTYLPVSTYEIPFGVSPGLHMHGLDIN